MNQINQKYKDIEEYHSKQPLSIREKLEILRQTIKQTAPDALETISYGMPAFKLKRILVYYAFNKEYIGFYPTPSPILHFKKELEEYKTSKGAIQFPIDKPLPLSLIKKIVNFRISEESQNTNDKLLGGIVHDLPEDMEEALRVDLEIINLWTKLTPIQRNEWICWVTLVKKSETRVKHIQRMIEELKDGKKQPCCWPGCPHRKPAAHKWFKNAKI